MRRLLCLVGLLTLSACQQTAQEQSRGEQPRVEAPRPAERTSASFVTPAGFRLPEGQGCSGEIARFRAVQDNDLQTGHVNQAVYDRIKGEIDQAASRCAAGDDAGARAALSATRKRFGYPG